MIYSGTTSELRDAIVAGTDVTSPVSFPGKITLNQLNAFSGALEPEALTNFKTLKVNTDGSVEETNVAKLLIDLQSGSGADDAKEEALIDIRRAEADSGMLYSMNVIHNRIDMIDYVPASFELIAKPDFSYSFARDVRGVIVSAEIADGEATVFKPAAFYISAKRPLVFLNGVLQNGDEVEVDSVSGLGWSASFTTAPEEGSLVEFYFDDAVDGDEEIKAISAKLTEIDEDHSAFASSKDAAIADTQSLRAQKISDKAAQEEAGMVLDIDIKAKSSEVANAINAVEAATSVAEVEAAKADFDTKLGELAQLRGDKASLNLTISQLEADIAKLNALLAEQMNIAADEVNEYNQTTAALESRENGIQNAKSTLGY